MRQSVPRRGELLCRRVHTRRCQHGQNTDDFFPLQMDREVKLWPRTIVERF